MTTGTAHDQVATAIVAGQHRIMGPVAWKLAGRVEGVSVADGGAVTISGDPVAAIERLVTEYSAITGPLGVRMCWQSAQPVLERNPGVAIPSFQTFA